MTLTEFKKEFSEREGIHFNSAGLSPISKRVSSRASEVISDLSKMASFVDAKYLPLLIEVRKTIAHYLGAEPSEISYFQNCGSALSQIAFSMKLKPGDQVITLDQEYASNFYPWAQACAKSDAHLVVIKSEPNHAVSQQKILDAIRPGVKCFALSWVQFQTGAVLDLKVIGARCKEVGARFVVDGIQGIGQLPISFRDLPIDALIGGSHKWLCSLNGQAYMAIKGDWLKELKPIAVGAGSYNRFGTYALPEASLEQSARKFEPGGLSFISLFALEAAMKLQLEVGVQTIADEIFRLNQIFRAGLARLANQGLSLATPMNQSGGITSFKLQTQAEANLMLRLQNERVAMVKRGEYVRASLHAFNDESEINRVLELISASL